MNKNKEIFHDDETGQLFTISGLNSDIFEPLTVLKNNEIVNSGSESIKRSDAILKKSLDL